MIGPQLEFLSTPSDKMAALLLPSLYLSPANTEQILQDFEKYPVKVIMTNCRMLLLPPRIQTYLHTHYQHFYGSVYLYAPLISKSQLNFFLKFGGKYRITAKPKSHIRIDGKRFRAGQLISFKQGDHLSDANVNYRLVLVPNITMQLDPAFREDTWVKMIKAIVA